MSSASSQGNSDQGFTMLLVTALLIFMGWLVWHFFKHPILEVLRWMRYGELWVVNQVAGHRYDTCLTWLKNARFADPKPSGDMITWTNSCFTSSFLETVPREDLMDYYTLSFAGVSAAEQGVMHYARWPTSIIFCGIAYYCVFVSPRNKFKTTHTLESFIEVQKGMWPVISPITKFNPMHTSARAMGDPMPDKMPLFAEAMSPEEWISYYRVMVTNNIPDRDATRRGFLLQLGPRWNGSFAGQPMYLKALIAACALKGAQKRTESDDLLGRIATFWTPKGNLQLDMKISHEIESILRDEKTGGQALTEANKHAYRTTALLGMLHWARSRGGVLAAAQFLWLRGTDRNLWYALNNLGRRSFLIEGAGAMAHFMAEQNARKALPIPRIDTAIVTLNQYMAERGQPIPPRENS